jgi:hypothetical protein
MTADKDFYGTESAPAPAMFFRFAKQNCCNYSAMGPLKKANYCWLEPVESKSVCLLAVGKSCRWFVGAVLPLDKDLQTEWERLRLVRSDPSPLPGVYQICQCGKRFKAGSNRQLRCSECSRITRREYLRKAKRKGRAERGMTVNI